MFAVLLSLALSAPAAPATPDATALLSERDALAWVGGPLGGTFESATPPTAENGRDHTTVRGWFPRGWDPRTAEAPPARGVMLTLHAMPDAESAGAFLATMRDLHRERAEAAAPESGATTFTALDSLGAEAFVLAESVPVKGGRPVGVATLMVARGRTVLQLQIWRAEGSASETALRAARVLAARLE